MYLFLAHKNDVIPQTLWRGVFATLCQSQILPEVCHSPLPSPGAEDACWHGYLLLPEPYDILGGSDCVCSVSVCVCVCVRCPPAPKRLMGKVVTC